MKNVDASLDSRTVAERAYALYLARGGEHGHDLEDWIRAEEELLRGERHRRTTPPRATTRARAKR